MKAHVMCLNYPIYINSELPDPRPGGGGSAGSRRATASAPAFLAGFACERQGHFFGTGQPIEASTSQCWLAV
jgi:hypothetical protein